MKTPLLTTTLLTAALALPLTPAAFACGDYSTLRAAKAPQPGYVAHEWGTFTSVQGADGIQLEWNPLNVADLPKFVYDRNTRPDGTRPPGVSRNYAYSPGSKTSFVTLQRMETPVIYFHADKPQKVDVMVKFPQGIHTEWFPQVQTIANAVGQWRGYDPQKLVWRGVDIVPHARTEGADALLFDKSGSHYFAARDTQAALLRVNHGTKTEVEKFLFYRGIGNFTAPLTAKPVGADGEQVELKNSGPDELRHFFVYFVRNGLGKTVTVDKLAPGETKLVKLQPEKNLLPLASLRADTQKQMQAALVREGLYGDEAWAMVRTWEDSWFAEQGLRVLYVLPRAFADRTLPLTLEPAPREVVRVMVGRAELITPEMEWGLLKEVVRYADPQTRAQAVENVRKLGLGRFTEPAMRRVIKAAPASRELSTLSWEVLQAASKPESKGKPVALVLPR